MADVSSVQVVGIIDAYVRGKASSEERRIHLKLRTEALDAYIRERPLNRRRLEFLTEYLACGVAASAARRTGVEFRTGEKWVQSFARFAGGFVLLTDEDTAQRRDRDKDRQLDDLVCGDSHRRGDHSAAPVCVCGLRASTCPSCQRREAMRTG